MSVKSISQGEAVLIGGHRLSLEEEAALNIILHRAAGEEQGAALYRLSWAMEDNSATYDSETGKYKFDPVKIPLCIEPNQASYHLLSWAPPTQTDLELEHEFHGEDFSNGVYTCILHFLDPETGNPFNPTASLLERIVPVLSDFNRIARATWRGFTAERNRLRNQKIAQWKQEEKAAEERYSKYAESLLEDAKPAFEGQPFSAPDNSNDLWSSQNPSQLNRRFSNVLPGERNPQRERQAAAASAEVREVGFTFSSRTPKKV